MPRKLLIFFICITTFNCAQDSNPQPKLTILSEPTPIKAEATPTPKEDPTTKVTDNLTPTDTIQAFCKADFDGIRTSTDTYQQVIPYVIWDATVETDAHIVSDFRIVNSAQQDEEANVAVVYTKIGRLLKDEKEVKIETIGATSDIVTYKLIQDQGRWKIQYPQPPPYISMDVAKKLAAKK